MFHIVFDNQSKEMRKLDLYKISKETKLILEKEMLASDKRFVTDKSAAEFAKQMAQKNNFELSEKLKNLLEQ